IGHPCIKAITCNYFAGNFTSHRRNTLQSLKLRRALLVFAALVTLTVSGAVSSWAQSPTTDDLQKKIDDLQQQLSDIKAKLASTPATAPPAGANAVLATPAAAPAPTPATTLGTLL